ncbi:MAG: hypothetical protein ACHQ51_13390 [Elusimicrobiota bacterium]
MSSRAALALVFVAATASASSRPAERGCVWTTLSDAGLGLEMLHQKCDLGFRTIDHETSAKDTSVYEVIRDTGTRLMRREPIVTVFAKKPKETPEAAVERVAFSKLSFKQRRHCSVVFKKLGFLSAGKAAYTITPDEDFAADIARKAGDQIPPPPCGDQGELPDGFTYFEFHADNPNRFVFVMYGQDEHPLFDESSLKFLP